MDQYNDYTLAFKALSDEIRLKIIDMISGREMCACEILEKLSISQSTLSYHMKLLCESGLTNGRKEGAWMKYTLNKEYFRSIIELLKNISHQ